MKIVFMEVMFVLFHFQKKGELSYDTRLRVDAAAYILQSSVRLDQKIVFVGGGGLQPSGAEQMSGYWQKMDHELLVDIQTILLETSNSTHGNIEEIKKFIQEGDVQKITLLTNRYHVARVRQELQKYDLTAIILSVEDILLKKQGREEEMRRYMRSYVYRSNVLKEKFLLLFVSKGTGYFIQKWREFRYW